MLGFFSQDLVGQEVNQARMEDQEGLAQMELKATKVAKESKVKEGLLAQLK